MNSLLLTLSPEIKTILRIAEYLVAGILGLQVLYYLFFAFMSIFRVRDWRNDPDTRKRMAIFVPAYKEDNIICNTARQCLKQNYDQNFYDVVILADSLKPETMQELATLPVKVVNIELDQSTKAKSINIGLKELAGDSYDIAVILDADNVMVPDFLERVNQAFNEGYKAFQGRRVAKNEDSKLSVLDGMSEEISNSIYRKGHRVMGLSSSLAGSGMAFDYLMFMEVMKDILNHAAEDKLMQMAIAGRSEKIVYDPKAVVYDEKVSQMSSFKSQRSRWLAAQYDAFLRFWLKGLKAFFRGNWSYASLAFQFFLIPKTIFLGLLVPIMILAVLTPMDTMVWATVTGLFILSMMLATPRRYWNFQTLKAMFMAPLVLIEMLSIVSRIRSIAIDKFVVTEKKVS